MVESSGIKEIIKPENLVYKKTNIRQKIRCRIALDADMVQLTGSLLK